MLDVRPTCVKQRNAQQRNMIGGKETCTFDTEVTNSDEAIWRIYVPSPYPPIQGRLETHLWRVHSSGGMQGYGKRSAPTMSWYRASFIVLLNTATVKEWTLALWDKKNVNGSYGNVLQKWYAICKTTADRYSCAVSKSQREWWHNIKCSGRRNHWLYETRRRRE